MRHVFKLSIVIPTRNRIEPLSRLLKSICAQTIKDFEIIIIDDCSDNFYDYQKLIFHYKRKFKEFHYLRNEERKGAPFSRNRGIKESRYDYIALVDDDDEWLPGKIEKQIDIIKGSNGEVGLIYTWADAFDGEGGYLYGFRDTYEGNVLRKILWHNFIPPPSVVVLKSAILHAGLFDESLPSCQDWDMWVRIAACGYQFKVVKNIECLYYKHSGTTIGNAGNAYRGYLMFFKKHFMLSLKNNPMIVLYYFYLIINIALKKLF